MLGQIWAIFRKDLTLELRTKEVLLAMLVFGILVLVILNFSFESTREEPRPDRVAGEIGRRRPT